MQVVLVCALLPLTAARAGVVINEVFYNAPDDLDDLQWIEFHNAGGQEVDLGGWSLDKGDMFVFPAGTRIEAQGYLVAALQPERYRESYGGEAIGPLKRPIKRGGERIELLDGEGKTVDIVRYKDREPWPLSADGYSASIERISPSASGDIPENWAGSPLPAASPKPAGTPGKRNVSYSAVLPPVIAAVTGTPEDPMPGQAIQVEAEVKDAGALREVSLLYRVVEGGVEGEESAVAMSRDAASGRLRASIPGQKAGTLVRYRIRAGSEAGAERLCPAENDLRPTFSAYVHDKWQPARISFGLIIKPPNELTGIAAPGRFPGPQGPGGFPGVPGGRRGPFGGRSANVPRPPRGSSAFVHVDQKTGRTTLFDHVNVIPRDGGRGYKIFFHKDRTLDGMSAVNMVFEGSERFLLAEALAYDVYRRAGNAACLTDFVRLWLNGQMIGYHLMVERPNRSFLRRNNLDDGGNLYKITWMGRDIVGQHEKKTNIRTGHEDLLAVIEKIQRSKGEEQWKAIQEEFNVPQVATYFAVNMIVSHWDGFFNNYYTYHDTRGTKKWEMYPWDQDKTWGYYDGIRPGEVFFDMPLTFGMEGARPPGAREDRGGPGGFGGPFGGGPFGRGGPGWWRDGGHFSRPLLANPQFRKMFLARTREILETIYTEEVYFPLIDELSERLKEDVSLRAKLWGDPDSGVRLLEENIRSLRAHVTERRRFLLAQEELLSAG